jgi:hypothetical protein
LLRQRLQHRGLTTIWTLVGRVGANVTSFTDTTVGKHKTYQCRVVAFNDIGTSDYCNIVTVLM